MGAGILLATAAAMFILARRRKRSIRHFSMHQRLLLERKSKMLTPETVAHAQSFSPRPTDVFICTFPKSGTTWVSHIAHLCRSQASTDFSEITEVVPWDICAHLCGQRLENEQAYFPRLFKSHQQFTKVPKGAKYIYVARDPADSFVSFYHFLPDFVGLAPGDLSMSEFCDVLFAGATMSGGASEHILGWWEHRDDPNILWVFYEDLITNLPLEIKRIAAFLEIPLTDDSFDRVLEKSSFAWMRSHSSLFDETFIHEKVKQRMGLPASARLSVGKVRNGGGGIKSRDVIPDEVLSRLASRWDAALGARGITNYEELRRMMAPLLAASSGP